MQLRRLAALERQKIIDRLEELERLIADYKAILASEDRQREIISTELAEIVDKYGDERRTRIIAADGDFSEEDFIPDDDVVVTITRGGYAKRTRTDLYRVQKRGGKGVRGASCALTTRWHSYSLPRTTSGSSSSQIWVGCIAPRYGSCRRLVVTPGGVTSLGC
ncbi:DNA gyrase subunit A [Cutibacterium acnes JCM 18918]|nr:DNA gyrase subunit A [Cutibacterium acnes JCM 18918]